VKVEIDQERLSDFLTEVQTYIETVKETFGEVEFSEKILVAAKSMQREIEFTSVGLISKEDLDGFPNSRP